MFCTFDIEEAVKVRQSDAAVDRISTIRQLVIRIKPVKVILTVIKLKK